MPRARADGTNVQERETENLDASDGGPICGRSSTSRLAQADVLVEAVFGDGAPLLERWHEWRAEAARSQKR